MNKEKIYEVDLFPPVQNFFQKKGFAVFGEVNDCDVVALKEDELLIIELKLHLNIDLLMQATNRQHMTDQVYIAIPKPKYRKNSKKWRDLLSLVRRLGLGMLVIHFLKSGARVELIIPPAEKVPVQRNKRRRTKLLEEVRGRHSNINIGGSNNTKIMTAYKENCIQIAYCLEQYGPSSPKALREMGTGEKTQSILSKNYYGWFDKVDRGLYGISNTGERELKEFPEIVQYFARKIDDPSE